MATVKNTYQDGMNLDTSPIKMKPSQYEKALNFKLMTDKGGSIGAIVNEKGNRLDFSIPSTKAVYNLDYNYYSTLTNEQLLFSSIIINGVEYNVLTEIGIQSNFTLQEFYDALINFTPFQEGISQGNYAIELQEESIIIVGLDEFVFFQTLPLFTLTVAEQSELKIIGLTNLDDKIILFTTSNSDEEPINSDGQIWVVDYDESKNTVIGLDSNGFLVPSQHLIYNNLLNFSTEKSITRALTRYETKNIARVYWTDFYNNVRSINIFNNNFAIEPEDLDLLSNVSFSKPVVNSVNSGGNIPAGSSIQIAYRLTGNNKATVLSPVTNPLPLYLASDTNDSYQIIKGTAQSNTTNNKSITFTINDLDTSYNAIEIIYIIHEFKDIPVIYSTLESLTSDNITRTFTNTESSLIKLTQEEINILGSSLEIAKDIAIKDNRLIAANLKYKNFEIPDSLFDSRSYRYNIFGEALVYDKNGNSTVIPSDYSLPETHDAICPYNLEETDPLYNFAYQLRQDGGGLGSTGKYINTSVIFKELTADELGLTLNKPWAGLNNRINNIEDFQSFIQHPVESQFNSYTSPIIHQLYVGYQSDEIYRFAIVFRSKKGKLSFPKWICDFRFPLRDTQSTRLVNFSTAPTYTNSKLRVMGIKFEVTIPDELKDLISGYEIVRVERKINDKRRLGTGALQSLINGGDNSVRVRYSSANTHFGLSNNYTLLNNLINPTKRYVGYLSPEVLFKESSFSFKPNDYIRLIGRMNPGLDVTPYVSPLPYCGYSKTYIMASGTYAERDIEISNLRVINSGNAISLNELDPNSQFINFRNRIADGVSQFSGKTCNKTCLLVLDTTNEITLTNGTGIISLLHMATYCRNITNQYGGNTFDARSFNQYISTGAYVPLNESSQIEVFGGDTFVNYFTYEYISDVGNGNFADDASTMLAFPVESSINTDLRHGNYFNKDRGAPSGSSPADPEPFKLYEFEAFEYNKSYNQENNILELFNAKNFQSNLVDELPFTIIASQPKQNGEIIDSWGEFLEANQIDVDGNYGPINSIHNFKDKLLFYQNSGFGIVAINERVTVPDENGTSIILGDGQVLGDYAYISKHTGCFHRKGVVLSENNAYHFDVRQMKLWRYTLDSKVPLSDVKGLSAYIENKYRITPLENTDNPTGLLPFTLHGAYEHRYNRVLFTILSAEDVITEENDRPLLIRDTFSYNELTDCFESFYSFIPSLYLSTGRKLLSVSTADRNMIYQHDKGEYGNFYGTIFPSTITYIVTDNNNINKTWNNLEWITDVYDTDNNDVYDDTFDFIRVSNNYQDTQLDTLQVPNNLKRRFRVWRHSILRNFNPDGTKDRINNPWTRIELRYNNSDNNRLIMHDLTTHFTHRPINNY